MRILLADDQPEICSAVRLLLEQEPGLQIVGDAVDAESVLDLARLTNPDVVLLDWELPGTRYAESKNGAGPRLVSELKSERPNLRMVALSGRPESREPALSAGADAFVSKGDPPEILLAVLVGLESDLTSTRN